MPVARADLDEATRSAQEDAEFYAQAEGINTEQAMKLVGWQDSFARIVHRIRTDYPNDFGGARILHEGKSHAFVNFKYAMPTGAQEMLESGVLENISIEYREYVGFSNMELAEATRSVVEALASDGRERFTASHDIETGLIDVALEMNESEQAQRPDDRRLGLPARARQSDVRVTFLTEMRGGTTAAIGGARLERTGQGSLMCTAGFTVGANGTRGISTAQHCLDNGSFTHENQSGYTEYSTTIRTTFRGFYGDMGWYTTSQYEGDDFYYDFGSYRDVSATAYAVEGQTLYKFGHASGRSYGTVHRTDAWSSIDGVYTGSLIAINRRHLVDGDSGGPLYYGGTAYGIAHGYDLVDSSYRDLYSAVANFPIAIGVAVLTS